METMEIQLRVVHSSWAPNVVMGTFSLNDHFATVLFDYVVDYSFFSTKFLPLLDVKPNNLNFCYVIEMANGRNEETNKIICRCTLLVEGIPINIDLIPFGHGSFDVVVGIEWLMKHRAEIICYEKIIRIALPNGETLEVRGEQPKKDQKRLSSMKTDERILKDIIVRDFPEVFTEDLSGLPPTCKVEFRIDLIPRAMPVAKSPYRLAPFKMQELANQL
ncbi:putative reverse transcriptase domain-containing protein [Tanacetum coccineum]